MRRSIVVVVGLCAIALAVRADSGASITVSSARRARQTQDANLTPHGNPEAFTKSAETVIDRVCSSCHGWDLIGGDRFTAIQWDAILSEMVSVGAEATADEMKLIRGYVLWSYGRVQVNTAPAEELAAVLGIAPETAQAIVSYRAEHGPFDDAAALAQVPGLDAAVLKTQAEALVFGGTGHLRGTRRAVIISS